ncbi:unnamed protein product, partial [Prorocentrum cordatum]
SKPRRPARLGARGARLGRAEMAADDGEDFDDLDALEQDGPGRLGPRPRRLRRHRGGGRGGRRRGPGRRPRRRRGAGEPAGPPRYEVRVAARRDGEASRRGERDKHARYPGERLTPFVFEDSWAPCQVVHVDVTVVGPMYAVQMQGGQVQSLVKEGRVAAPHGRVSARPKGARSRATAAPGLQGGVRRVEAGAWNGAGFALARDLCAAFAGAAQREKHPRRGGRGVGARRPGALGSAGVAGVGRDPRPLRVVTTITTGSFSLFSAFGCPYRA